MWCWLLTIKLFETNKAHTFVPLSWHYRTEIKANDVWNLTCFPHNRSRWSKNLAIWIKQIMNYNLKKSHIDLVLSKEYYFKLQWLKVNQNRHIFVFLRNIYHCNQLWIHTFRSRYWTRYRVPDGSVHGLVLILFVVVSCVWLHSWTMWTVRVLCLVCGRWSISWNIPY